MANTRNNPDPEGLVDGLPDTHRGGGGGFFDRLDEDSIENMNLRSAIDAHNMLNDRGIYYQGPTETWGRGAQPVLTSVPKRSNGYASNFKELWQPDEWQSSFGNFGAQRYMEYYGRAVPGQQYELLHLNGHGQVGTGGDRADNIIIGSRGANTEMMPFDDAIKGNPDVVVATTADTIPGTPEATSVHMAYYHSEFNAVPFFTRTVDAQRPNVTKSEMAMLQAHASAYKNPEFVRAEAQRLHEQEIARLRDQNDPAHFAGINPSAASMDTAFSTDEMAAMTNILPQSSMSVALEAKVAAISGGSKRKRDALEDEESPASARKKGKEEEVDDDSETSDADWDFSQMSDSAALMPQPVNAEQVSTSSAASNGILGDVESAGEGSLADLADIL